MAIYTTFGKYQSTSWWSFTETPKRIREQVWWNDSYIYRRNLSLSVPVGGLPIGHVVYSYVPKTIYYQNKVRQDLLDLEVGWLVSSSPETWQVLPHQLIEAGPFYLVTWELPVALDEGATSSDMYIYYGNPSLANQEDDLPPISPNPFPIEILFNDQLVNYTHPGSHWVDGVSQVKGAKAAFAFWGPAVQVLSNCSVECGIAHIQVDNEDWTEVDLFSSETEQNKAIYVRSDLGEGRHIVRVKAAGAKSPEATSDQINISKIRFRRHSVCVDMGEEQRKTLLWGGAVSGVA